MNARTTSLELLQVTCQRGDRLLFHDVSWCTQSGSVVAIRGPNGAGKTTLLRVIAGLGTAQHGRILWCGSDPGEGRHDGSWAPGWIGHADGLKAELTPRENLAFHRELQRSPALEVDSALERVGLGHVAHLPCRVLSAGQRRRAALARLLVARMDPWLLDEPTTALDHAGDGLVERLIDEHCSAGGIAVVVSHRSLHVPGPLLEVALG